MIRIYNILFALARSLYFNFRVLSFKQAIKLPFWLNQKVVIHKNTGIIKFGVPVTFRMITFTTIHKEIIGKNISHWTNEGTVSFTGDHIRFGTGCCITAYKNSSITFDKNVTIGGNSKIMSQETIVIGANLRTAWDVQIIDTNFHYSKNSVSNEVFQKQAPIIIGKDCWIANRSSLMKGAKIPDGTIVASNSVVNKQFNIPINENSIFIGGAPAKIIGFNISRMLLTGEEEYNLTKEFKLQNVSKLNLDSNRDFQTDIL